MLDDSPIRQRVDSDRESAPAEHKSEFGSSPSFAERTASPILITGSHRSGSTWLGHMLGAAPGVGCLREPFSLNHRPGILRTRFPFWFPYICRENEAPYIEPIAGMLAFRYQWAPGLAAVRTPGDLAHVANDLWRFSRFRRAGARQILKDPIALFSAEWLADRWDMRVVVQVRHPAGFASSLKRYGWNHPFSHFLAQPLLMRDFLHPFESEIRDFSDNERSPFEQAILLWKLFHHTIALYRRRHPGWIIIRHEDVACDPMVQFDSLYRQLGLTMSPAARARIVEFTDASNPTEARDHQTLKRDSRSSIWAWKSRLTADEIRRVREETSPLWREFYTDEDW